MKTKKITQKIIAGKYRHANIELPSLQTTRSTKSIMKESLFNTLQFDLVGKDFVEVFGGSGSMGLEALSRGARHGFFFEKDKQAFEVLQKNCKSIATNDTTCIYGNSFDVFPKFMENYHSQAFFYFDPPFSYREGMDDVYEKTLFLIENIPSKNSLLIAVEHMSTAKMPESIGVFSRMKTKKFGKSALTYYK